MTEKKLFASGVINQPPCNKGEKCIKVGNIKIYEYKKISEKAPEYLGSIRLYEEHKPDLILWVALWRKKDE